MTVASPVASRADSRTADVAVVGAGLAGLSAARALRAAGASVAVLEARDRVGGRTESVDIGRGRFDVGGQWLGPTQDRVAALCRELGVATFPTFTSGTKILDVGGEVSTYKSSIPSMSLLKLVDMQLAIKRVERMARRVPMHNPAAARRAAEWDSMTVATWKRKYVRSKDVRDVMDVAVRVVFGAEASELSLLHFLFYLHAGGGLMRLVETENGAQQDRFVPGAQALSLGLAEPLGDALQLSAPVRSISQDDDGVTVRSDAGEVRARQVIVAVPPPLTARIAYAPALPSDRAQLVQRAPMGATVKCLVTYERPFWRERGFSGEVVCTGAPISAVYDNCSHDNRQPALLAFIVGRAARCWARRSDGDRRRAVLGALAKYFGPEALHPEELVVKDWTAEPWTRGCPVGIVPPGVYTTAGITLRQPVGRIHWAGTETATVWNGYMEGAMESGERAARECLRLL